MSIIRTFTATPRPGRESAFMLLGAWRGIDRMAAGNHAVPAYLGQQSVDSRSNPSFTRDRAVVAAKPGSPPRGVKR